jgi:predicted DNA-binding transcriptional regulator AlpA
MRLEAKGQGRRLLPRWGCESRLLRAPGLAQLLGISEQAVRNALYRGEEGKTIPHSFKLGHRRVWLRREAMRWLTDMRRSSGGR